MGQRRGAKRGSKSWKSRAAHKEDGIELRADPWHSEEMCSCMVLATESNSSASPGDEGDEGEEMNAVDTERYHRLAARANYVGLRRPDFISTRRRRAHP